ncbi:MAG: SRPBCC domain-containing protein [Rhodobacteraceae bacterium]|jgi:uncharacterized protein YndB with AHSA1/START domain|nr:SRPBCC domain-containing protein [Paracoccaceae bacterium]
MADIAHSHRPSEVALTRLFRAPVAALWRCWSEPDMIARWWAPAPVLTRDVSLDLRSGGFLLATQQTPDGAQDVTEYGILLVEPKARIVLTDVLTAGWRPAISPDIGFSATIGFAGESGGTRYTVVVQHADVAARRRHESLGFHETWGIATSQLGALAESLGNR